MTDDLKIQITDVLSNQVLGIQYRTTKKQSSLHHLDITNGEAFKDLNTEKFPY